MTPPAAPCLSVVMPAFNAATHIQAALQSLADQTRTDFEVLVIDDGSTDDTAARVRAFANALPTTGPVIRLIQKDNAGVSAARNDGIQTALAPLIGFLDADDRWSPNKVVRHVDLMTKNPDLELSFSGFRFVNDAGDCLDEHYIPQNGLLAHADLMKRNIIHTSTVILRASVLDETGLFDTTMATYEDFDLWLRISARAPDNLFGIGQILTDYRRHDTQTTSNWQKMHQGWQTVAARQAQSHPKEWAKIKHAALAQQLEYCAALAYNAGEIKQCRALMWRAVKTSPRTILTQRHSLIMTGIATCTYLPRPLQIVVGRVFHHARRTKHRLDDLRRGAGLCPKGHMICPLRTSPGSSWFPQRALAPRTSFA